MDERITILLEKLAEKLGTTADKVWEVLLIQAKVSAIYDIAFLCFFIVFTIVTRKPLQVIVKRVMRKDDEWTLISGSLGIAIILVVILISAVVTVSNAYMTVTALVNPEYWAIQQILKHL